ncbi:MAG: hypothetical protein ACJZ9L_00180 [Coraliomargaritaceae bacterium]
MNLATIHLWQTLLFEQQHRGKELYEGLKRIYVQLRSEGQESVLKESYISIEWIYALLGIPDRCGFG